MKRLALFLLVSSLVPAVASAQEPASAPIGLNADLGVYSAYLFRGLNVFAEDGQMNQNAFVAPSLTWTGLDGRLAVGYWGAYQFLGGNIGPKIDGAAGAESDLWVTWSQPLADSLSLSAGVLAYLYPMADEAAAGTSMPTVLEPSVGLSFSGPLDLGLKFAYFLPAQSAIQSWRYLYVNPTVGKSLSLTDAVSLSASAGFGYKAAADFEDNVLDALVSVAAPINLGMLYVKPSVSFAWTNIEALGFGDEVAVFGGVNVGVDL